MKTKSIVFDAYGTLFDVNSAAEKCKDKIGDKGEGFANLWLSQSYKFSEVSLVTTLKYLALVFAIIFGFFIWNEIPTTKTLIGSSLVILSSIIIFRREIFLNKSLSSPRHE